MMMMMMMMMISKFNGTSPPKRVIYSHNRCKLPYYKGVIKQLHYPIQICASFQTAFTATRSPGQKIRSSLSWIFSCSHTAEVPLNPTNFVGRGDYANAVLDCGDNEDTGNIIAKVTGHGVFVFEKQRVIIDLREF